MITDADVKKLEKAFATKKDLKNLELNLKGTENLLNYKIETLENNVNEFKGEFTLFKDSVLKSLDWLVGAFKKFEEEHTVLTEQNNRTNDKLDVYEERISNLEQRLTTP